MKNQTTNTTVTKSASPVTKSALLAGIKEKTAPTKAPKTKPLGKRAMAAADPASLKRMQVAQTALVALTKLGQKGELSVVQCIRTIVGNFPLLRREALSLLTAAGMNKGTVNTQFQWVRSGKVDVPALPKGLK